MCVDSGVTLINSSVYNNTASGDPWMTVATGITGPDYPEKTGAMMQPVARMLEHLIA